MLTIQTTAKVIEKATETYTIEGKELTVNKIRAIVADEIFDFRFKGDNIKLFNDCPSKGEVNVTIGLTSPKEKVKVSIIEIQKVK